jgi:hypothetical protein
MVGVVTAGAAVGAGDVGAADGVGASAGPRSGLGHRTITPRGGTTTLITSTRTKTANAKPLWRGRSSRQKNVVDQASAAYMRGDGHERAFRNTFDRIERVRIDDLEVVQTHGILTGNFIAPRFQ